MAFRSHSFVTTWILKKSERFIYEDDKKRRHRIKTVTVQENWSPAQIVGPAEFSGPGAFRVDVHWNIHLSGVPLDSNGKRIKGQVSQENLAGITGLSFLPAWLRKELEDFWEVRSVVRREMSRLGDKAAA